MGINGIVDIRLISLLLIILSSGAMAQEDTIPEVSKAPLAAMQKLAPLAGSWDMTVFITSDDGATWEETPPQQVELTFEHKGFVLLEIPADLTTPGFHMRTTLSYDQYREVYRKVALDDVWGVPDIYDGRIEGNRLIMTNLSAGTLFPLENGKWRGFRLSLELEYAQRTMWVEKTDDNGASWQPAFRIEYTRRG